MFRLLTVSMKNILRRSPLATFSFVKVAYKTYFYVVCIACAQDLSHCSNLLELLFWLFIFKTMYPPYYLHLSDLFR
uniref:Uncharacterized protein n=1 Tax=Rhizophora mucronata TaxID=61149 RepID=A0A2P2P062_RHIMU